MPDGNKERKCVECGAAFVPAKYKHRSAMCSPACRETKRAKQRAQYRLARNANAPKALP